MKTGNKDGMSDVAENMPKISTRPTGNPEGTVVSHDGTLVTLDKNPVATTSITPTKGSMNSSDND